MSQSRNHPSDASASTELPEDRATLLEQIEALEAQRHALLAKIKHLRDSEDASRSVFFPEEIFQAQQGKLCLETEIEIRRRRIRRIELGIDGQE